MLYLILCIANVPYDNTACGRLIEIHQTVCSNIVVFIVVF